MKESILSFVLFALLNVPLMFFVQSGYKVKGHIISAKDNKSMVGVSILGKSTTNGVITDVDGNYTLEIESTASTTLLFSYISIQSQAHVASAKAGTLNVHLVSDTALIDEVVIVAHGARKKGTITGTTSTVKAKEMGSVLAAGSDQSLQEQVPGLSVISNSGEPSKAVVFQIRGTNLTNLGTVPLSILDGVPISGVNFNTASPGGIESTSMLKDVSFTSIYDVRTANGAVIITSKRGLAIDKAKVTLCRQWGFSQLASNDSWVMMNTPERIQFEKKIGQDTGKDYNLLSRANINWLDEASSNRAPLQSYELSVNRATDRLNYYVSGGSYGQDGITQSSTFRCYNMYTNVGVKASGWLRMGTNTMMAYEEVAQAEEGDMALYTPTSDSRFMLSYRNPYNADGSLASESDGTWKGTGQNPIEWMANNPVKHEKYRLLPTVFVDITSVKNLTVRAQFGVDHVYSTSFMRSYPGHIINNNSGKAGRSSSDILNLTETLTANYRWASNEDHSLSFMLGQEGTDYRSTGFRVVTRGQTIDRLTNVAAGTRASSWRDANTAHSFMSFSFRTEYNYKDLYYTEVAARIDASSRSGEDHHWGAFWSLGFIWNIRSEAFLKDVEWLTDARIRLSTGISGNSTIPDYDHLMFVSRNTNHLDQAGLLPLQSGNEELDWEQTWANNVDLSAGLFNRVNVNPDSYHRKTTNMLMFVPQSYTISGKSGYWDDVGAVTNRGVEVAADGDAIHTRDFTWNLSANFSYNKNRLLELYNGVEEYVNPTTGLKYIVGHSIHEYFMDRYASVNPVDGDALWYTADRGLTTEFHEEDKIMTGETFDSPWADGLGTTLMWKGLSLSAQSSWMAKHYVINNDRFFGENNGICSTCNQSRRLLYGRWKKPSDITGIPCYDVVARLDDRPLEDASFPCLKNLTLACALPQPWLKKTSLFSAARVYLQRRNLLTWTGFTGLDPEVASNIYRAQCPTSRRFTLGIEVTFQQYIKER